jgi:hypothetical protein
MKKFLFATLILAAAPIGQVDAAYYWERTRNTHKADGTILMVDPSSPRAVVADNYNNLADYYGYKNRSTTTMTTTQMVTPAGTVIDNVIPEECMRDGDVLAVSHTMPRNTIMQDSSPVYIGQPKIIAYPATPVEAVPLTAAPAAYGTVTSTTVTTTSNEMMPPSYVPTAYQATSYETVTVQNPASETVTSYPTAATAVSYTTDVSPGYGYPNSMEPLQ